MSYQRLDPDYLLGIQRGALMGLLWQRLQQLGVPWHRVLRWMALSRTPLASRCALPNRAPAPARHAALILANGSFAPAQPDEDQAARAHLPRGAV